MKAVFNKNAAFESAVAIRAFEQSLLKAFKMGLIRGTTHTCIGQEVIPAVIGVHLQRETFVVSNHRNHGHYLGTGGNPLSLLREILGDPRGISSGLGGSQHIHSNNFISHGILGGLVPFSVGKAFARARLHKAAPPVVTFIGDGTFGEGILYESMNLATLYQTKILIVVENNGVSQTTRTAQVISGNLVEKAKAFIPNVIEVTDTKFEEFSLTVAENFSNREHLEYPRLVIVNTRRLGPHSKGESSLNPWLGEDDPLFIMSDTNSAIEFQNRARGKYLEILDLFVREFKDSEFELEF